MYVDIAKRNAKFLGVDMHLKKMNKAKLAKHFKDCVWYSKHFIFNLNSVGKFALSELLWNLGFEVILSGEGTDEMFSGYAWFLLDFLGELD